ncbi:MAG TPA: diacylglycerol kinase, partial [Beutenbergiaceae bacterium]|nr:diacylglycerol kinase [Beutenbergiaceae bacterium]
MRWELLLSVAALVLALIAVVIGVMIYRRLNRPNLSQPPPTAASAPSAPHTPLSGPAAFIVNPTKV